MFDVENKNLIADRVQRAERYCKRRGWPLPFSRVSDTIVVCCCDSLPGMHAFMREECDGTRGPGHPRAFVPTQAEKDYQQACKHEDVFDRVCIACGKVC